MSEEMNGKSPDIASPRLSKIVVIVIAVHVVAIVGGIVFAMLRGNTGGKTDTVASTEEVRDEALPSADSHAETGASNVPPVTVESVAPAPQSSGWNMTVNVPAPTRVAAPVTVSGDTTYTVRRGDTLSGISRKFSVSVAELKQRNGLVSDALKAGQTLKLPAADGGASSMVADHQPAASHAPVLDERPALRMGALPAPPAVSDSASSSAYQIYKVVSGDTLYKIARQFNTKPDVIAKINNISDPSKLKIGAEIKVPLTVRETARPVSPSALQDVNMARLPHNRS
jgi:LysM repeat protein